MSVLLISEERKGEKKEARKKERKKSRTLGKSQDVVRNALFGGGAMNVIQRPNWLIKFRKIIAVTSKNLKELINIILLGKIRNFLKFYQAIYIYINIYTYTNLHGKNSF
jgi:hypothetical protein